MQQKIPDTIERGTVATLAIVVLIAALWGMQPIGTAEQRTVMRIVTATPGLPNVMVIYRIATPTAAPPTLTATPAPTVEPSPVPIVVPDAPAAVQQAAPVVYAAEQQAPPTPVVPTSAPVMAQTLDQSDPRCTGAAGTIDQACGLSAAELREAMDK